MVAYDPHRWPDAMRLSESTVDALSSAIREQRRAGGGPLPALGDAIAAAATEARDRGIPPEALLVQLKMIADQAGMTAAAADEAGAVRSWIVSACVSAYFST